MVDFDPFANQGGQAAWDPQHSADVKKQADELSRRLAADTDQSGNEPSPFSDDDSAHDDSTDNDNSDSDDSDAAASDVENIELPDGTA